MTRGDIVTVAGGGYAGKPRPAVIVQSDDFALTGSVTVCLLTHVETDAALLRLPLMPGLATGLVQPSWIMVEKIVTVRRAQIGRRIGRLGAEDIVRLDRALLVFLGLAAG
ncbi:MAG TPA: type II toxin-antitoxin system PemK/MazF family toxin [Alphaproteobacteria bacterium]|nr:type II toxin-antitoxin system PemK/MazF family toxin [Alphaproteobacteria bacterium]